MTTALSVRLREPRATVNLALVSAVTFSTSGNSSPFLMNELRDDLLCERVFLLCRSMPPQFEDDRRGLDQETISTNRSLKKIGANDAPQAVEGT